MRASKLAALFCRLLKLCFDHADMLLGALQVAREPFELRIARGGGLLVLAKLQIERRRFSLRSASRLPLRVGKLERDSPFSSSASIAVCTRSCLISRLSPSSERPLLAGLRRR